MDRLLRDLLSRNRERALQLLGMDRVARPNTRQFDVVPELIEEDGKPRVRVHRVPPGQT